MARPFPYRNARNDRMSVYIPVTAKYHELVHDLDHSIHVMGRGFLNQWHISDVQCYLVACYGEQLGDYPYLKRNERSYLIRLPDHLNRLQIIDQLTLWALRGDMVLTIWDPEDQGGTQRAGYLVKIRVDNFPLQIWDVEYISCFLSQIGEVRDIGTECTFGRHRGFVEAVVWSHDPKEIPPVTTVYFDDQWSECPITVVGWEDDTGAGPPSEGDSDGGGPGEEESRSGGGPNLAPVLTGLFARHEQRRRFFSSESNRHGDSDSQSSELVHEQSYELLSAKLCRKGHSVPSLDQSCRSDAHETILLYFGTHQPMEVRAANHDKGKKRGALSVLQKGLKQVDQKRVRHFRITVGSVPITAYCTNAHLMKASTRAKDDYSAKGSPSKRNSTKGWATRYLKFGSLISGLP